MNISLTFTDTLELADVLAAGLALATNEAPSSGKEAAWLRRINRRADRDYLASFWQPDAEYRAIQRMFWAVSASLDNVPD